LNPALPPTGWLPFSRVRARTWLQPYTDVTLEEWLARGSAVFDTLCPHFGGLSGNVEEMAITNRELFEHPAAGVRTFRTNDRPDHIAALADIAAARMHDWLTPGIDSIRREQAALPNVGPGTKLPALQPNAPPTAAKADGIAGSFSLMRDDADTRAGSHDVIRLTRKEHGLVGTVCI